MAYNNNNYYYYYYYYYFCFCLFVVYCLISEMLALELNNINSHSALLSVQEDSELLGSRIKCSNGFETELRNDMLISTTGRFKCAYPLHVISRSNASLYSWSSVMMGGGSRCNYIHVTVARESSCDRLSSSLLDSLSLSRFCKSLASIDLNGCRATKKEGLPAYDNYQMAKQISKYRLMLQGVTLKAKVVIGVALHIVLFVIALALSRNRRCREITLKICTDTKTESLEIKSPREITTKDLLNISKLSGNSNLIILME